MTDQELIDKYLTEQLTTEEKSAFELRLKDDAALQVLFQEIRELQTAIETHELKSKFNAIFKMDQAYKTDQSNTEAKIISIKSRFHYLKYVAAVLLLIAVGWFGFQDGLKEKSTLALSDIIYQDPGLPTPMSSTKHYEFYDAMVDYKSDDFLKAYNKWTLLDPENTNDTIVYYRSMALLNNGNLEEAEALLTKLDTDSKFQEKKILYTIDILIKSNKITEAKIELEKIKNSKPDLYDQLNNFLTN
ncbi:MAG: hypothetical protein KJN84_16370 [Bacteroidia bacterium]|nr:hypothetical protein [Bacteroidia bacterium]